MCSPAAFTAAVKMFACGDYNPCWNELSGRNDAVGGRGKTVGLGGMCRALKESKHHLMHEFHLGDTLVLPITGKSPEQPTLSTIILSACLILGRLPSWRHDGQSANHTCKRSTAARLCWELAEVPLNGTVIFQRQVLSNHLSG